jgi:Tol biopolymer transport system component
VIDSQPVLDAGPASWSPTGNNIIFWSGLEGFAGQIWTIPSNGKHREQLTRPDKPPAGLPYPNNDDPGWAPDAKKKSFSARTGKTRKFPNLPRLAHHPIWSLAV